MGFGFFYFIVKRVFLFLLDGYRIGKRVGFIGVRLGRGLVYIFLIIFYRLEFSLWCCLIVGEVGKCSFIMCLGGKEI